MEDDEEALTEDEGQPRGTLGTEFAQGPPRNLLSAPTILHSQAEFLGPRARYVTISVSLRGGWPPAPFCAPLRLTETVTWRTALPQKTPPATAKHWTASGGF